MRKEQAYNEKECLARLAAGDEVAFTTIYDKYHPLIYNYVLRFVKIPALAEDLVHDIFMKVWEMRGRIHIQVSFSAWLHRISRNHVFRKIKKIVSETELREELIQHVESILPESTGKEQQYAEYERFLQEALRQLPPQRGVVFRLCRLEGKSYDQAAEMLGISRNAIKQHMVLGMRSVRDYFFTHGDILLVLFFFSGIN